MKKKKTSSVNIDIPIKMAEIKYWLIKFWLKFISMIHLQINIWDSSISLMLASVLYLIWNNVYIYLVIQEMQKDKDNSNDNRRKK